MKRALSISLFVLSAACGDATVEVAVNLQVPSKAVLSPFDPSARLSIVRVSIDGSERLDEVSTMLAPGETRAVFSGYPADRSVTIRVEGFDRLGSLVAFARSVVAIEGDDLEIPIAFRRTLAYIAHRPVCGGGCSQGSECVDLQEGYACREIVMGCGTCSGACVEFRGSPQCRAIFSRSTPAARTIYVVDLATRSLVDEVEIPGADPRVTGLSPIGGEGVLVTYNDGLNGFIAILSASDGTFAKTIMLPRPHEIGVLAAGERYGAAAGGGVVSVIDFEQQSVTKSVPLGGKVLDAVIGGEGKKAVFITSSGIALLDLTDAEAAVPLSPGEVAGASGVGVSGDGNTAFITSSQDRRLYELDLLEGGMAPNNDADGFAALVGAAAFSERSGLVLAIQAGEMGARVFPYDTIGRAGGPAVIGTLPVPADIASGPDGRRLIVVSTGTSSASSGLTIVDADPVLAPQGSTVGYPRDPDDVFLQGTTEIHQRYQPFKVTALYGH
jgi:DNA-binding beta-propeller fold protein YncE